MKGKITLEEEQYSELGSNGFFGRYDVDNSSGFSGANVAERNDWLGKEITGNNLASGSDVAGATMYMTPEKPKDVPEENWLPIKRKDEELDAVMRICAPDLEKLKTWKTPEAEMAK